MLEIKTKTPDQLKVGDKIKENFKKGLTGVVIKIDDTGIHVNREDGELWITQFKFYQVSWEFVD